MKPKLEDVLFLENDCQHKRVYGNKVFQKILKNRKVSSDDDDELCPEVKISPELLENLIRDELKGKYYSGFVKYFKSNAEDCILKAAKNAQKSVAARIKANALFAQKEHNVDIHKNIWELYSKSIALAPAGSKELVLAYETRSNILLHLKQYADCIKDIDRALCLTEFDLLKVKLLCRKMTCLVATNKDVCQKENLWKTLGSHCEKVDVIFKDEKFLKMIEQAKNDACTQPESGIKDEQKRFTSFTNFPNMTLQFNKENHIIADRDYEAGEPIIVTKPTIASVDPKKFHTYCSHCLSFMWAGIPCDECSLCMYCSEKCKEEAWKKYHALECKVNPHIDFSYSIYYKFKNSLKIFLMGVKEFGSIPKLLEKVREVEKLGDYPNFMRRDKFFDSEFLNYYILPKKTFTDSCSLSNCVKNTCFLMAYLTQILEDIFEKDIGSMKGKELAKDDDFVYSIVVLLKIMMLCRLYMGYPRIRNPLDCPKYDDSDECKSNRCCPVGKIFHFFKGLIEKSCNPNLMICESHDGKVIYYCVQPIKKTEAFTVAEMVAFYKSGFIDRHSSKQCVPSIHELCQCTACLKEWPPVLASEELTKFRIKFERRSFKVRTKGTELTAKYIDRDVYNGTPGTYFVYNEEEIQELAKDTNTVVSICGQPSFASCWMITTLSMAFLTLYGYHPVQTFIPEDC